MAYHDVLNTDLHTGYLVKLPWADPATESGTCLLRTRPEFRGDLQGLPHLRLKDAPRRDHLTYRRVPKVL